MESGVVKVLNDKSKRGDGAAGGGGGGGRVVKRSLPYIYTMLPSALPRLYPLRRINWRFRRTGANGPAKIAHD